MAFNEHPLRRWAVHEMHLRRFTPVAPPCRLLQYVRLVDRDERDVELARLADPPLGFVADPGEDERHVSGRIGSALRLIWERHTEATTLTLFEPDGADEADTRLVTRWLEDWPGMVVRATRIVVEPSVRSAEARLAAMNFAPDDLVCCDVNQGVRLWSDFRVHGDGYGRLLLAAEDVAASELGRIVQRVQELGNYRNLALIGFPLVQDRRLRLGELERMLTEHTQKLAANEADDEDLLDALTALSAELEEMRAATSFRLGATRAYAEIAADRLQALDVRRVENHQSLIDYTERRLVPATRSCSAFEARMGALAERITGVMRTLNTRIDTRIKAQNRDLLASMERSTNLQLRLQHLVEGLSVIAAGYYAVGLIGFLVKGTDGLLHGKWVEAAIGAATLPVLLLLFLLVRHWRGRVLDEPAKP